MLGHKVFQAVCATFVESWGTVRAALPEEQRRALFGPAARVIEQVDVLDWPNVAGVIGDIRPDVVVNCVGIVKQRADASAAIPSITINALLPHRLAALQRTWGGRLVHISTDCVFSGARGHYTELDESDAHDLYGRSKFLGEVADENAVTLRTSMIGRELSEHRSLLDWLLQQRGRMVRGYRRAFYSGLTTNELTRVILLLITEHPRLTGLFQVTSDTITKFDLLRLIVETYGLDLQVDPDDEFFCDRSLIGDKFRLATGYQCPAWPALIAELYADGTPYTDVAGDA
jgi:dTDP-4-dehydrorhamnose reductase